LVRIFQSRNIRSIELANSADIFSNLIIVYNDGKQEIHKYDAPDGDESNLIRRALKTINKKSLDRQGLEKLQTVSPSPTTNSPEKFSYTPYLIGGGIAVIFLGIVLIGYRLRIRSQKKNK